MLVFAKMPKVFIYLLFALGFFLFSLGMRHGAHWFFTGKSDLIFRIPFYFGWLIIFILGLLLLVLMSTFSVLGEVTKTQGVPSKVAGVLNELFFLNGLFFIFLGAYVFWTRGDYIVMYGVFIIGFISLTVSIPFLTLKYFLKRLRKK